MDGGVWKGWGLAKTSLRASSVVGNVSKRRRVFRPQTQRRRIVHVRLRGIRRFVQGGDQVAIGSSDGQIRLRGRRGQAAGRRVRGRQERVPTVRRGHYGAAGHVGRGATTAGQRRRDAAAAAATVGNRDTTAVVPAEIRVPARKPGRGAR